MADDDKVEKNLVRDINTTNANKEQTVLEKAAPVVEAAPPTAPAADKKDVDFQPLTPEQLATPQVTHADAVRYSIKILKEHQDPNYTATTEEVIEHHKGRIAPADAALIAESMNLSSNSGSNHELRKQKLEALEEEQKAAHAAEEVKAANKPTEKGGKGEKPKEELGFIGMLMALAKELFGIKEEKKEEVAEVTTPPKPQEIYSQKDQKNEITKDLLVAISVDNIIKKGSALCSNSVMIQCDAEPLRTSYVEAAARPVEVASTTGRN